MTKGNRRESVFSPVSLSCPVSILLSLQMRNQRNGEVPRTSSLLPATYDPPEQSMYTQHLLIPRLSSFNRVANKHYCKTEPIDLNRSTPCCTTIRRTIMTA